MAYKLAGLEILRNLFVLAYIACPHYRVYWLYDCVAQIDLLHNLCMCMYTLNVFNNYVILNCKINCALRTWSLSPALYLDPSPPLLQNCLCSCECNNFEPNSIMNTGNVSTSVYCWLGYLIYKWVYALDVTYWNILQLTKPFSTAILIDESIFNRLHQFLQVACMQKT